MGQYKDLDDKLRTKLIKLLGTHPPLNERDARDVWLLHLPPNVRRLIHKRSNHPEYDLAFIIETVKLLRFTDGGWALLVLTDAVAEDLEGLTVGQELRMLRQRIKNNLDQVEQEHIREIDKEKRPCPTTLADLIQAHQGFAHIINRDGLVQEIRKHFTETSASESRPIVLYGQPMSGKTKILHRLCKSLGDDYVPVYVTVQGSALSDLGYFLYDLALQLTSGFSDALSLSMETPSEDEFKGRGETAFGTHWNHLRAIADGRQPITMFDEVERLLGRPGNALDDIVGFLHRFVHNPDNGFFVLAGSERIVCSDDECFSLLIENGVLREVPYEEEIAVSCFSAMQEYLNLEDHVLKCMIALCDGHPRIVEDAYEAVMSVAHESPDRKIHRDDLEAVVSDVVNKANDALLALWLCLSPSERDLVELASTRPFTPFVQDVMSFLECHLRDLSHLADTSAKSTINYDSLGRAARDLRERNLIEWKNQDEDLFCFKLGILPVWRRWHRPDDRLVREEKIQ